LSQSRADDRPCSCSSVAFLGLLACLGGLLSGCKSSIKLEPASQTAAVTSSAAAKAPSKTPTETSVTPPIEHSSIVPSEDELTQLHSIGTNVATAVLARDLDAVLKYDRDDSRSEDEAILRSKKGDLYCYIFDSDCITSKAKARSVYEKLSTAQRLEIRASVTNSTANGHDYGLLVFYDGSQITETQLHSDFVCTDAALRKVASWHFERVGAKWTTRTLFDYETEGLCPESD
jgi:hypothetical protein